MRLIAQGLFYETVFGCTFEPWGPPDFYLIHGAGLHGALQKRTQALATGSKGFECSFAVDDLETTMASIRDNGGSITGQTYTIPTIGQLVKFTDTEGNSAIIVEYDPQCLADMGL